MGGDKKRISRRLYPDFPFIVWAIGWAALLKGLIWLSTDPNLPAEQLTVLGYKYIICTVPYVVCGIGLWRKKKWAAHGLVILCVAELIFFILCPFAMQSLAIDRVSLISLILSVGVLLINGPLSTVIILFCLPVVFRKLTT